MFKLLDYQTKARDLLIKQVEAEIKTLQLVARMGMGKTITTLSFVEKLFELDLADAVVIIAPNELHHQWYNEAQKNFSANNFIKNIQILNPKLKNRIEKHSISLANWHSLWPENNLRKPGELNNDLDIIIKEAKVSNITRIAVILDEEHLNKDTSISDEIIKIIDPIFVLGMSATPSDKLGNAIEMSVEDGVREGRIKKGIHLNYLLDQLFFPVSYSHEQKLIYAAIETQKVLPYKENNIKYEKPLIVFTIPDDPTNKRLEEIKAEIKEVDSNIKVAVYLSKYKDDMNKIKNGDFDIVLCKTAITTGWDCPRAHIMILGREYHSEGIYWQTIGRITRTPEGKIYDNDLLNYGYLFTTKDQQINNELNGYLDESYRTTIKDEFRKLADLDLEYNYVYRKKDSVKFDNILFEECITESLKDISFDKGTISTFIPIKGTMQASENCFDDIKLKEFEDSEIEKQKKFDNIIKQFSKSANRKAHRDTILKILKKVLENIGIIDVMTCLIINEDIKNRILNGINQFKSKEKVGIKGKQNPEKRRFNLSKKEKYFFKRGFDKYDDIKKYVDNDCILPKVSEHRTVSNAEIKFIRYIDNHQDTKCHLKLRVKDADTLGILYDNDHIFYPDILRIRNDGWIEILEYGDSQEEKPEKAKALQEWIEARQRDGKKVRGGIIKYDSVTDKYFINQSKNFDASNSSQWQVF